MKESLAFLLLVSLALGAAVMAEGRKTEEVLVRALDDQERVATRARDVAALDQLWSEQLTVNAPNNQVVVGRKAVLDMFVHSGIINFASFDREVEFVRADGNLVFIMGREKVKPLNDAPGAGLVAGQIVERRFTNIWKKEGTTWRLFVRHANVIARR
jgi:ketosteroid isomerase-like protein